MLFIIFALLAVFLISCMNNNSKVVVMHPDGYYKEVYHVKDDSIRHGMYQRFYANGVLADSCNFRDNLVNGQRKLFSENGILEIQETYVDGIFEGPYTTYFLNGQLKKIQIYKNDQIQGEVKEYYEDGKLKAITQFLDNMENGAFQEYYENGNLHWEGFYQGGDFEQDTLKEFNSDGLLIRKLFCEQGICQTAWTLENGYKEVKSLFQN